MWRVVVVSAAFCFGGGGSSARAGVLRPPFRIRNANTTAVATGLTTGLINNDIDVIMFRGITGTGRPDFNADVVAVCAAAGLNLSLGETYGFNTILVWF